MAFYRDVDPKYCQGDLIDGVPNIHLKSLDGAMRKCTLKGGREAWEILPYAPDTPATGPKPDFKKGEKVPAFCQVSRAVLITHSCDIDKDAKHRLIALVRPLHVVPAEHQVVIRENRNFNCLYLPGDSSRNIEEGYADFWRITCITPDLLEKGSRLASLSDEGVEALHVQLYRFLTHREILPGFQ